jgi:SAM-dependent methyltransferase
MTTKPGIAAEGICAADGLACPECGGKLPAAGQRLECGGCRKAWPVIDGVPQFVDDFPYWGEIPHERMLDVNRRAAAEGWRTALTNTDDSVVRRAADMILNLDRANWQSLAGLPDNSRVLDLGAGCGTNSHSLALHFSHVTALEPVAERIEFMRHRFAQEKLHNVRLIRSSVWTLPFPNESFDMVAMNGVLEWVPTGMTGDPRALQLKALRNVHRLLRPGGSIYVGIENRYAAGHFIGYRDPHCGLPWVTVAPRPLAHWLARRHGQPGYRNYLYGSAGYRKLLFDAGFGSYECYLALPSYNHPRYFIPLDRKLYAYYSRAFLPRPQGTFRSAVHELLLRVGLLGHLEYSFAIVARKEAR